MDVQKVTSVLFCLTIAVVLIVTASAPASANEHPSYEVSLYHKISKGEKWQLVDAGDGLVGIRNTYTGYYLGTHQGGVVLWSRLSQGEKWRRVDAGNGRLGLKNVYTGQYLGTTRDGRVVIHPRLSLGEQWIQTGGGFYNTDTGYYLGIDER